MEIATFVLSKMETYFGSLLQDSTTVSEDERKESEVLDERVGYFGSSWDFIRQKYLYQITNSKERSSLRPPGVTPGSPVDRDGLTTQDFCRLWLLEVRDLWGSSEGILDFTTESWSRNYYGIRNKDLVRNKTGVLPLMFCFSIVVCTNSTNPKQRPSSFEHFPNKLRTLLCTSYFSCPKP